MSKRSGCFIFISFLLKTSKAYIWQVLDKGHIPFDSLQLKSWNKGVLSGLFLEMGGSSLRVGRVVKELREGALDHSR